MEYLKKWDILRKYWQNNDKKLPKTVVFRENQKCCSHAHALKIPLFFLKITKNSFFFQPCTIASNKIYEYTFTHGRLSEVTS